MQGGSEDLCRGGAGEKELSSPRRTPVIILRRTKKLQKQLPASPEPLSESEGALGDWYANRIVVHRQPLVLLVSSKSLLAVLVRAKGVGGLPKRLPQIIESRLMRLGVDHEFIHQEVGTLDPVQVAPTADRSVVGIMVDYAKMIPYYVRPGFCDAELAETEERLWGNPCHAGRPSGGAVFPDRKTHELLSLRWGAG